MMWGNSQSVTLLGSDGRMGQSAALVDVVVVLLLLSQRRLFSHLIPCLRLLYHNLKDRHLVLQSLT
jgi:hypothetical protein